MGGRGSAGGHQNLPAGGQRSLDRGQHARWCQCSVAPMGSALRCCLRRWSADAFAGASPSRRQDRCQTPLLRWSSELDFYRPQPATLLPTPLAAAGHGEHPACHYGLSSASAGASPRPHAFVLPSRSSVRPRTRAASITSTSTARCAVVQQAERERAASHTTPWGRPNQRPVRAQCATPPVKILSGLELLPGARYRPRSVCNWPSVDRSCWLPVSRTRWPPTWKIIGREWTLDR